MQQPGRQRLKLWLEEQIESGKYPGVDWLDKPARIFQIPWKHAARHGWSIDRDATLFRSWAMHTGRYRPGKDKPDPKTWKANFRCALNSLPDICELQEHSKKRGNNASRVYKMLPGVPTHRRRRGPRSPSRPREKTPSLGPYPSADTCTMLTWQPVTHFSEVQRIAESHIEDTHGTQMQGTWGGKPDEQEQNEAAFKLMDHVGSLDIWNQTEGQRAWRAHTLWDHCHCSADDNPYCLHTDNYSELFAPSYIKEFSDWSTY